VGGVVSTWRALRASLLERWQPAERFQATVIVASSHTALAQEEAEMMAEAERRGQSVEYVDPTLCRIYRVTDPA
jgi:hypothetical protein